MSFLFLKILDLIARHGYFPLPVTLMELRHLISEASHDISEEMVRKAVVCMRTRAAKLVAMDGREKDLINFGNPNIIHLVLEAQC